MNLNSLANIREAASREREAAAVRDTAMAPILRELSDLSAERAAAELDRRGFGYVSYMTVRRARQRLGLPVAPKAPRQRDAPKTRSRIRRGPRIAKANQEIAAE